MNIELYLLELAHGHYYVGQAPDALKKYQAHLSGTAAAWTKQYPPVKPPLKIRPLSVNSAREAMCYENWMTMHYMQQYGWQNVRGGEYLAIDPEQFRPQLQCIYDTATDRIRYYIKDNLYLFGASDHWFIYVLDLLNGNYYIGSTKRLGKALGKHFNGTGILWTAANPPIRIAELITIKETDGNYLEIKHNKLTDYIRRYGRNHVIGGNES